MRIADTSFLYALFSSTDDFHERARRAAASSEPILVPPEIYSETIALIHYRQGFDPARAAGEWLRNQGHVEVGIASSDLLKKSWEVYSRASGGLSYPDSAVVSWCRERRAAPLAFDSRILAHARD